jgi:hypothetical protein
MAFVFARFRRVDDSFEISGLPPEEASWTQSIYAFVINDEIVRIGSSKEPLRIRMRRWSNDVSAAFRLKYGSTKQNEPDLWSEELAKHGEGTIWARQGTQFRSPITYEMLSGYQDEESYLIAKHQPRLNRGSHRLRAKLHQRPRIMRSLSFRLGRCRWRSK